MQEMTEIIPGLQGDIPANSRKGVPYVGGKYDSPCKIKITSFAASFLFCFATVLSCLQLFLCLFFSFSSIENQRHPYLPLMFMQLWLLLLYLFCSFSCTAYTFC